MKYYKIDHDLTSKIVGSDYPQSWKFTKEYQKRVDNPNAIYALSECLRNYRIPNYAPDIDGFVLSGRAKLSNFVSTCPMTTFLFMDEKAKQVLQTKCNLGDHEFYEAVLYAKNNQHKMYFLGLFYNIEQLILFAESSYVIKGIRNNEDIPQEYNERLITSINDIYRIEKKVPYSINICFSKLKINKMAEKLDMYYFVGGGISNGIVTERFKEAVEEAGLTGLVFEPIEVEFEE